MKKISLKLTNLFGRYHFGSLSDLGKNMNLAVTSRGPHSQPQNVVKHESGGAAPGRERRGSRQGGGRQDKHVRTSMLVWWMRGVGFKKNYRSPAFFSYELLRYTIHNIFQ